ncbi:Hypothetical protein NTJ_13949 [Nesidiocoris tenuis]|uniref:Uncharacterized protein n=1 Tax=Nesidiocoris tenuis TaxID=355587 RepID=A0ABN7BE67_9HEMI|nr:Hypothetical protein NTJ_13949 [Nesidiocoris tenuis]
MEYIVLWIPSWDYCVLFRENSADNIWQVSDSLAVLPVAPSDPKRRAAPPPPVAHPPAPPPHWQISGSGTRPFAIRHNSIRDRDQQSQSALTAEVPMMGDVRAHQR